MNANGDGYTIYVWFAMLGYASVHGFDGLRGGACKPVYFHGVCFTLFWDLLRMRCKIVRSYDGILFIIRIVD